MIFNSPDTQILLITCDNASNNDMMIEELAVLIDNFPSPANQTRCFLHILNLVVKSIIWQFDLPKKKKTPANNENLDDLDDVTAELLRLAGDIDLEEELMADSDEGDDENVDGWIDERETMTKDELRELAVSIGLVRLLLTKV